MKFARIVFIAAGVWGIFVLTPLYFLFDVTGRAYPPPADYPHFFYGFLSVTMAWQIAFLIIGSNPIRFRPLMIAAMVEKFGYLVTLAVLYAHARISPAETSTGLPDLVLGILFIASYVKTAGANSEIR